MFGGYICLYEYWFYAILKTLNRKYAMLTNNYFLYVIETVEKNITDFPSKYTLSCRKLFCKHFRKEISVVLFALFVNSAGPKWPSQVYTVSCFTFPKSLSTKHAALFSIEKVTNKAWRFLVLVFKYKICEFLGRLQRVKAANAKKTLFRN